MGRVIQNAISVAIGKNRLNAEIAFHIPAKTRFGQLNNLSNAAVSSRIAHILNYCYTFSTREGDFWDSPQSSLLEKENDQVVLANPIKQSTIQKYLGKYRSTDPATRQSISPSYLHHQKRETYICKCVINTALGIHFIRSISTSNPPPPKKGSTHFFDPISEMTNYNKKLTTLLQTPRAYFNKMTASSTTMIIVA